MSFKKKKCTESIIHLVEYINPYNRKKEGYNIYNETMVVRKAHYAPIVPEKWKNRLITPN